jgi:DNA-binding NtrC family response regulator
MLVMRVRLAQLKLGRPITVLAYARQDLPSSAAVRQLQLQREVKKAGHRFEFADDTNRLESALKTGKFDIVMADVTVADQLREQISASPFHPVILPVTYKRTKTEDSATQKKYHCLLRTPSDSDGYFEAIDQALQWKAKSAH